MGCTCCHEAHVPLASCGLLGELGFCVDVTALHGKIWAFKRNIARIERDLNCQLTYNFANLYDYGDTDAHSMLAVFRSYKPGSSITVHVYDLRIQDKRKF